MRANSRLKSKTTDIKIVIEIYALLYYQNKSTHTVYMNRSESNVQIEITESILN